MHDDKRGISLLINTHTHTQDKVRYMTTTEKSSLSTRLATDETRDKSATPPKGYIVSTRQHPHSGRSDTWHYPREVFVVYTCCNTLANIQVKDDGRTPPRGNSCTGHDMRGWWRPGTLWHDSRAMWFE